MASDGSQRSAMSAFLQLHSLPAEAPWLAFAQRQRGGVGASGQEAARLQRALRGPPDASGESRDAFVRPKRESRALRVHADAECARAEFARRTRAAGFERAAVGRRVRERVENRRALEAALRLLQVEC